MGLRHDVGGGGHLAKFWAGRDLLGLWLFAFPAVASCFK